MSDQVPLHRATESPTPAHSGTGKRPAPWRITWIGLGLALLLWFGPNAYLRNVHRIAEVEYQAGNMSEADYSARTLRLAKYAIACKVGAGVLCLASLLYMASQVEIRRPRQQRRD